MTEYWFRPKERGIGAGVPLNWKGWALFGGYVGCNYSACRRCRAYSWAMKGSVLQRVLGVALISVPFLYVAWKKTEGGWRWRSGEEVVDERERA